MQAIQTVYKGYKFRSRLEARWAVFFDSLGITWEYELEGYVFKNGVKYLPDFYLPTFGGGTYVEVKSKFTGPEIEKCKRLAKESGKDVRMAEGVPDFRTYDLIIKSNRKVIITDASPNADQAIGDNRMYVACEFAEKDGTIKPEKYEWLAPGYEDAVYAARSARFEFGESGPTI